MKVEWLCCYILHELSEVVKSTRKIMLKTKFTVVEKCKEVTLFNFRLFNSVFFSVKFNQQRQDFVTMTMYSLFSRLVCVIIMHAASMNSSVYFQS